MFKLDDNFLQELGLGGLPAEEKKAMLNHIYETLEMRVGMKLAEQMTNDQLDEFEGFIDRNDEPGALKWLESNFPNYKQVVADELEKLKAEISASAPQILAASAGQQSVPAGDPAAQDPYVQPPASDASGAGQGYGPAA
jgi:predicted RNA-binding Zn ribbon-like protein